MSEKPDFKFEETTSSVPLILPSHGKKVWAMGGGKGGIGKSFIISNLAISVARMGKRVTVVDLDLGSANLHTCLGCDSPRTGLSDFLSGRADDLSGLINKTSIANLNFISGANDALTAADITPLQHSHLMKQILNLPSEYIFLDLGAGTHDKTLDFFLLANRPLVGITPEPTSIENAYRFIRSAFYRMVKNVETKLHLKSVVDQAMDQKNNLGIRTPSDLLNKIAQLNPGRGEAFKAEVQKFQINLIMNQVRTRNDIDTGQSVRSICKKYFGIETHYVGYLDYDNAVWQSVRKRRPLILEYPYSNLVSEFLQIAKGLDENERHSQSELLRTS